MSRPLRPLLTTLAGITLLVSAAGDAVAGEPACLAGLRKRLRGADQAVTIKGVALGKKRLVFRRGAVLLVIDHAVLAGTTREFLKKQGADRFPEETKLLKRFAEALQKADEVDGDALVKERYAQRRLEFRLAEVLERGAFALRRPPPPGKPAATTAMPAVILRVSYSHHCGDLCGAGGRVFVTESCEELLSMQDWIS